MKRVLAAFAALGVLACSDSGPSDPKVVVPTPPPPPASFVIRPAVDTTSIGYSVFLVAERADSMVDEWISSDTSIARLAGSGRNSTTVLPIAAGTVTITGRRQGDSGQATLVIRPSDTPAGWEAIPLAPLDGTTGIATAVNESGTVVGWLRKDLYNPVIYAFVYTEGVTRNLKRSPDWVGDDVLPMAIGASGTIVGSMQGSAGTQLVVWDSPDAVPRPVPVLGASLTQIVGVNAHADILYDIGDYWLSSCTMARVWRNDVTQDLGALTDSVLCRKTWATALNNSGQIVGGSAVAQFCDRGDCSALFRPFLWKDGVMQDLGDLGSSRCSLSKPKDCTWAEATGINANGVVVGMSGADTLFRAFIWENGAMRDLGAFPGRYTSALAINDRAQVLGFAGRGFVRDGYTYGDTTFLWDNGAAEIVVTGALWPGPALGPNGEVVGSIIVAGDSVAHAFVWQGGHLTDLGRGSVIGVDRRGEVVGNRGSLPTLWRKKS